MNDVRVKSENQSGGITAQNVTMNSQFDVTHAPQKEGPLRRWFWWIFGIAAIVSALAAVITIL